MKFTSTFLISVLLISVLPLVTAGQKSRRSPSIRRPTKTTSNSSSAPAPSIVADTSIAQLPPKYVGDNAGDVYQQPAVIAPRLRKSQFETTSDYETRIERILSSIKIGSTKTISGRFSFVHPHGKESYDADTQTFKLEPDTNYEIGLGYEVPELPHDVRVGRDYSSIDLTRTSRTVGSRIGRTAIGIRRRITVRTYSALRLVISNRNMKWADGLRFRISPQMAREASGRVWLAVTGRLAPPYVLNDSDVDNATLDDPEEAHSFHFYLFFVPDSLVLYNISTGKIYGAWDLTQSGTNFDQTAESPMPRRAETSESLNSALIRKPRILSKPVPIYPEEARHNQITGTVQLSVLFTETRRY